MNACSRLTYICIPLYYDIKIHMYMANRAPSNGRSAYENNSIIPFSRALLFVLGVVKIILAFGYTRMESRTAQPHERCVAPRQANVISFNFFFRLLCMLEKAHQLSEPASANMPARKSPRQSPCLCRKAADCGRPHPSNGRQ